ncbi:MAG: phosphatidate cytidylyltransferase [Proteobacteria bacterium]|nr:phosphatidate cytidylyltransferase [Pseudomonadota bacterium]
MALGNLAQRFLVAVVAAPILILALHWQRHELTWAIMFIASLLAMKEFFAMTLPPADRLPSILIGAVASAAFFWLHPLVVAHYQPTSTLVATSAQLGSAVPIALVLLGPGLYYLFRFGDMTTVAKRFTATVAGIVYCGFLTTFLSLLHVAGGPSHGGDYVICVLLIAWIADTGGYFAGRFLGKAKLYEAVSPKKTWAGAWGGLLGSVLGVVALKLIAGWDLAWHHVFLLAIPGGMLGQMGDLAESLIKRSTGVKDSGALLPGHGGILDRIDAVLFIAPYVYCYLTLIA